MKKTNLLVSCAICAFTMFLVTSCKKGDTGPAGAAGPAGPAGASGAQGPAGEPGTANVIYSPWFDVTYTIDTVMDGAVVTDTIGYYADIDVPKLDNDILNSGEIKVYFNANVPDAPAVVPLPFTDLYAFFGVVSINPLYFLNTIELYSDQDASTFTVPSGPSAGQKAWQYRYILIPGGTTARTAKTVDWNDYKAVQKYLGLKD